MLRIDRRAGFLVEGAWFWRRYRFRAGLPAVGAEAVRPLRSRALADAQRLQRDRPVALLEVEGRRLVVVPRRLLLGGRRAWRRGRAGARRRARAP